MSKFDRVVLLNITMGNLEHTFTMFDNFGNLVPERNFSCILC